MVGKFRMETQYSEYEDIDHTERGWQAHNISFLLTFFLFWSWPCWGLLAGTIVSWNLPSVLLVGRLDLNTGLLSICETKKKHFPTWDFHKSLLTAARLRWLCSCPLLLCVGGEEWRRLCPLSVSSIGKGRLVFVGPAEEIPMPPQDPLHIVW